MGKFKIVEPLNFRQIFYLEKFMFGHTGFIAGGCFKNIFNDEKVRDIDMFFQSGAEFEKGKKIFRDLVEKYPEAWQKSYENKKVWAVYSKEDDITIELIKSVFGTPQKIISDFDFSITKFAYFLDTQEDEENTVGKRKVIYHEDYFEHLHTKRLVLDDQIPFPVSTFNRSYKYRSYGYGLCKESKVKLIKAIHDLSVINEDELGLSLYDGKD